MTNERFYILLVAAAIVLAALWDTFNKQLRRKIKPREAPRIRTDEFLTGIDQYLRSNSAKIDGFEAVYIIGIKDFLQLVFKEMDCEEYQKVLNIKVFIKLANDLETIKKGGSFSFNTDSKNVQFISNKVKP